MVSGILFCRITAASWRRRSEEREEGIIPRSSSPCEAADKGVPTPTRSLATPFSRHPTLAAFSSLAQPVLLLLCQAPGQFGMVVLVVTVLGLALMAPAVMWMRGGGKGRRGGGNAKQGPDRARLLQRY